MDPWHAPQPSEPSLCLEGKFLFRRNSDTHFACLPKFAWSQIPTVTGRSRPGGCSLKIGKGNRRGWWTGLVQRPGSRPKNPSPGSVFAEADEGPGMFCSTSQGAEGGLSRGGGASANWVKMALSDLWASRTASFRDCSCRRACQSVLGVAGGSKCCSMAGIGKKGGTASEQGYQERSRRHGSWRLGICPLGGWI